MKRNSLLLYFLFVIGSKIVELFNVVFNIGNRNFILVLYFD